MVLIENPSLKKAYLKSVKQILYKHPITVNYKILDKLNISLTQYIVLVYYRNLYKAGSGKEGSLTNYYNDAECMKLNVKSSEIAFLDLYTMKYIILNKETKEFEIANKVNKLFKKYNV